MSNRPKILLITGGLGPGGTELSVMALARGLARRGAFEPQIALLGTGGRYSASLRRDGIDVTELALTRSARHPASIRKLWGLKRLVREQRIDVVHTFLFDADVYGMFAARLGSPRAVVTTRRAIKSHRPDHLRLYRWTNRYADRIVANSEAVRRFTLENEFVAESKVLTIPNGVDTERFSGGDREAFRREQGFSDDDVVVASAGTLKPVKGQDLLVEALLPLMGEDPRISLLLAGNAQPAFAARLQEIVRRAGLEGRLRLAGNVDDVPSLLAGVDLFVLPSRSEGMSNALLEAMAAGAPIVATDAGGNSECLAGDAGVVVGIDVAQLRGAIQTLLADASLRHELGQRAAGRARAVYSMDAMLAAMEKMYREVLD